MKNKHKQCVCGGRLINREIVEWCGKGKLKDVVDVRASKYVCNQCGKVYWRPFKRGEK